MVVIQYSIVLVCLDPTIGSEIKKTRPCVIISPDEMNRHLNTIVISPMTSNLKSYPTRVAVEFGGKKGMIVLDQIRTIDKSRVVRVYDEVPPRVKTKLKNTLREIFVD